jgi:aryl-alcohol dehydrogenase-like predicted oxidoreductase
MDQIKNDFDHRIPTMEKRKLGNTNLSVTALGYGAMELRGLNEAESARLLNGALDGGINYVDTSPDYGLSESYIGKTIAHRRSEFYLATKCGCNVDAQGKRLDPGHIWSREHLLWNIENSLRLLKTDYVDVWQLHGTLPGEMPGGRADPAIQTMQDLKKQGKVRYIGISLKNGGADDPLYPAGYGKYISELAQLGVFDVMQVVYGGLTRRNELLITYAAGKGIGMIIRGVIKRYHGNYDELFEKAGLDALRESGECRNSFLIRFALCHPAISTFIIGTKNLAHLTENIQATAKGKLADDVYDEAKRRLDAIGVVAESCGVIDL